MNRILIAEDEPRLAAFLEKGLRANGFVVSRVADGPTALALAHDDDFDLLVLDLGLPGLDGMSVLRTMRQLGRRMPVVILSARDDVVSGLDRGADDYVTKPFRFEELLARIRVRLRDEGTTEQTVLRRGDLALDLRTRRASVDGRSVELSAREFTMLETLLRHRGQVLSREQLLEHVWGYEYAGETRTVDVHVHWLRAQIEDDPSQPRFLQTVRGVGYVLRPAS